MSRTFDPAAALRDRGPVGEARYAGSPFLKLLDAYVLDEIGSLADENRAALEAMTPRFQQTFKHAGTWEEIVAAVMELEPGYPGFVRASWDRWCAVNGDGDPLAFAHTFVDWIVRDEP